MEETQRIMLKLSQLQEATTIEKKFVQTRWQNFKIKRSIVTTYIIAD